MKQKSNPVRRKTSTKNYYFSQEQDQAISDYQKTECLKEKQRIYVKDIHPSFVKLVENLISIYKFSSTGDSYEDLKNDCISFLFETLGKFDPSRGTRAFSYFNVVAKRWLIIRSKSRNQFAKRQTSMDDPEGLTSHETFLVDQADIFIPVDTISQNEEDQNIFDMLEEIEKHVKTAHEKSAIASIKEIFSNVDEIELFNKSAILVYMREASEMQPKQLTSSMQNIKKIYRKLKAEKANDAN